MAALKRRFFGFLTWTERYTKTDMVYLVSSSFWLILGQAGLVLISFGTTIAFGHFASQDLYGNYKYVLSLAGLFASFAFGGIATAVTTSAARGHDGSLPQGFRLSLRWAWIPILCSLAAGVYYYTQGNTFLAGALALSCICIPFMNGWSLFDPFLNGKKEFKRDVLYVLGNALFPAVVIVIALLSSGRAVVILAAYFIANTLADGYFYWRTERTLANAAEDPLLVSYSTHLSIMGAIAAVADKIDSIIIFTFLGPARLAVYAFAIIIPEQIKAVVKLVTQLSVPGFAARSLADIRTSIWRRVGILTAAIAVVIGLYWLAAPYIFALLFPRYLAAVPYTQWYSLSIITAGVIVPLTSVFQAHRHTRQLYWSNTLGSVVLIISLPLLVFTHGIPGAVASQILYRLTILLTTVWQFATIPAIPTAAPAEQR